MSRSKIAISIFIMLLMLAACSQSSASNASSTSTPGISPTPLTREQRVQQIFRDHYSPDNLFQPEQGYVWIHVTVMNITAFRVKSDCHDVQRKFWMAHPSLELESVDVFVDLVVFDRYGNDGLKQVGACSLKKLTEARFNWGNLDPDSAWDAYDSQSLTLD